MKQVFVFILFTLNIALFSQNKYVNIDFRDNKSTEELEDFFGDSTLNKYKVYFTGENHQFAYVNSELEFKILTYLNKTQGVNHFLFEQSPAVGYIMTKVVIENNLKCKYYLKERYFKPFYDLILDIKELNRDLDSINKISVHGIDIERFPAFSIFALSEIIDTLSTEGETGLIYESIVALATSEFKNGTPDDIYNDGGTRLNLTGDEINAWTTFETIIEASQKYKDELKVELGDNFDIFMQILEGVKNGYEWYHSERDGDLSAPIVRERFMLAQFKSVYALYPNSKFYGQFGRCHLHGKKDAKRCYSHDMQSIASRINSTSDSTLNGKVLTMPVYYSQSNNYDTKIINALNLSTRFDRLNEIFIIDLEYLNGDNPIAGFNEDLPFVIINNYEPKGSTEMYSFEYSLTEFHLGAYYGFKFINGISKLNNQLSLGGNNTFSNKFETRSVVFDYISMNDIGYHFGFNYTPLISNGDRFQLKSSAITFGNSFPFGNKFLMGAIGLNYTYGQVKLIEQNVGNTSPNLIQSDSKNVTVYKNDIFTLDPNLDLKLTLPIISINTRVGYALDVSGKYWKLDGKMKNFTKTSFTGAYVQVGLSLNIKDEY